MKNKNRRATTCRHSLAETLAENLNGLFQKIGRIFKKNRARQIKSWNLLGIEFLGCWGLFCVASNFQKKSKYWFFLYKIFLIQFLVNHCYSVNCAPKNLQNNCLYNTLKNNFGYFTDTINKTFLMEFARENFCWYLLWRATPSSKVKSNSPLKSANYLF